MQAHLVVGGQIAVNPLQSPCLSLAAVVACWIPVRGDARDVLGWQEMRHLHCGGWRGCAADFDGSAWRLVCLGFHCENASVGVLAYVDLDMDSSIRNG